MKYACGEPQHDRVLIQRISQSASRLRLYFSWKWMKYTCGEPQHDRGLIQRISQSASISMTKSSQKLIVRIMSFERFENNEILLVAPPRLNLSIGLSGFFDGGSLFLYHVVDFLVQNTGIDHFALFDHLFYIWNTCVIMNIYAVSAFT